METTQRPPPLTPCRYFVSFAVPGGYGNAEVQLAKPIRRQSDIHVATGILRNAGAVDPVVLHFIRLPDA